jgi:OmpA family
VLNDFFPKYLSIVLKPQYRDKIAEIRIEGHTDTTQLSYCPGGDDYICNMELSQNRARNVLSYLRALDCFRSKPKEDKSRLQFWLTANGLSYGRTADKQNKLTFYSGLAIDKDKSRRVEFRIVTTSDAAIEQVKANN